MRANTIANGELVTAHIAKAAATGANVANNGIGERCGCSGIRGSGSESAENVTRSENQSDGYASTT